MSRDSVITCPICGHQARETMPEDACVHFWACPACENLIRPAAGDCCVFCSYGTARCPPQQDSTGPRT